MKKLRYCFVLAAMLISNAVFAVDFGGLLNNLTTIKTNKDQNFKLDQKDSASLWFKTVFDETGMNYFIADFIYDFERDFDADKTTNASPKTGDVAPIAALAVVMMGAFGAMVVASKKRA